MEQQQRVQDQQVSIAHQFSPLAWRLVADHIASAKQLLDGNVTQFQFDHVRRRLSHDVCREPTVDDAHLGHSSRRVLTRR